MVSEVLHLFIEDALQHVGDEDGQVHFFCGDVGPVFATCMFALHCWRYLETGVDLSCLYEATCMRRLYMGCVDSKNSLMRSRQDPSLVLESAGMSLPWSEMY